MENDHKLSIQRNKSTSCGHFFYNFRFPRIKWTKWNKKLLALVMEFCFCSKFRCVPMCAFGREMEIFRFRTLGKGWKRRFWVWKSSSHGKFHEMCDFNDFSEKEVFPARKLAVTCFMIFSRSLSFSAGCTSNLMQRLMGADKVEQWKTFLKCIFNIFFSPLV